MRNTLVVEYQDEEITARLVVARADIRAGMTRTRLQVEADALTDDDPDVRLLRRFTYPDVIAATVEATGIPWPLAFEEYMALPERLGVMWEAAVYQLNPHWVPGWEERAESEKKESPTPSIGD